MQDNEGNVREMTRTEKNFYRGVTIDVDGNEENFNQRRQRTFYLNYSKSNIFTRAIGSFIKAVLDGDKLARIAATLIVIAFAALTIFVALPIIFIMLAIGLVIFALLNNFR